MAAEYKDKRALEPHPFVKPLKRHSEHPEQAAIWQERDRHCANLQCQKLAKDPIHQAELCTCSHPKWDHGPRMSHSWPCQDKSCDCNNFSSAPKRENGKSLESRMMPLCDCRLPLKHFVLQHLGREKGWECQHGRVL